MNYNIYIILCYKYDAIWAGCWEGLKCSWRLSQEKFTQWEVNFSPPSATLAQHWPNIVWASVLSRIRVSLSPQHTPDIDPKLVQCWPTVCDAGPTLNQLWVCVLGVLSIDVLFRWIPQPIDYSRLWFMSLIITLISVGFVDLYLEHESNVQCWLNAGPMCGTLRFLFIPVNMRHWPYIVSMLGQRLWRWPNIETTLRQRIVFAWISVTDKQQWLLSYGNLFLH